MISASSNSIKKTCGRVCWRRWNCTLHCIESTCFHCKFLHHLKLNAHAPKEMLTNQRWHGTGLIPIQVELMSNGNNTKQYRHRHPWAEHIDILTRIMLHKRSITRESSACPQPAMPHTPLPPHSHGIQPHPLVTHAPFNSASKIVSNAKTQLNPFLCLFVCVARMTVAAAPPPVPPSHKYWIVQLYRENPIHISHKVANFHAILASQFILVDGSGSCSAHAHTFVMLSLA